MSSCLDVFSGAGGLSFGFETAGFRCVAAIELDKFAAQTYAANFPRTRLFQCDVREMSGTWFKHNFSGVDVLLAGPPCQGFSVAGAQQYGRTDPRNSLVLQVSRIARIIRPRFVILENVRGVLRGKTTSGDNVFEVYLNQMLRLGYFTRTFILQAAHFGVPQNRGRAFIVSARRESDLPSESFCAGVKRKLCTVQDAISDLPLIEAGDGTNGLVPYPLPPRSAFQREIRRGSKGVLNHVAMRHTPRLIERFKHIGPGESLVDVNSKHGQRARNSHETDANGRFKMNNTRLLGSSLSPAVTGNFQSTHLHPTLHRNLTAREGARLQSFPDWFVFLGPRTLPSFKLLEREGRTDEIGLCQYKQIGNAVPPMVAFALASAIKSAQGRKRGWR